MWKSIKGYKELYEVSNLGRVRSVDKQMPNMLTGGTSLKKGIILSPWLSKGYLRAGLSLKSKHKYFSVHKLVADAFVENKENKPHINHIDGDKLNNAALNLEWCTPAENVEHSINILERNRWNKWVFNTETGIMYFTIKEASNSLGRKNIGPAYLGAMLAGIWKNRTPLILCP